MRQHEKINYVEYPSRDIQATRQFFQQAFGWTFEDYGPDYIAFANQGLDGGFFRADAAARTDNGSALIVFYSADLSATLEKVRAADAEVIKPIFSFPGGRRFHFLEPGGNEFAVWSEPA
jgi:predicted enzyme related to lactoylglutathione lyase